MLLNSTPFSFVIDLAALASRREYLKLDKWLNDKYREHKVSYPYLNYCLFVFFVFFCFDKICRIFVAHSLLQSPCLILTYFHFKASEFSVCSSL